MAELKQDWIRKDAFLMSSDGEDYELFLNKLRNGFKELMYTAPYSWAIYNNEKRVIITYTEGDVTILSHFKTEQSFKAKLKEFYQWYKDNGDLDGNDESGGRF